MDTVSIVPIAKTIYYRFSFAECFSGIMRSKFEGGGGRACNAQGISTCILDQCLKVLFFLQVWQSSSAI